MQFDRADLPLAATLLVGGQKPFQIKIRSLKESLLA
jgi:hypothetical protein